LGARRRIPQRSTPPLAWILAIARNRCLEILRRRGVDDGDWDETAVDAIADASPTPEQRSLHAETTRTIGDCLRSLEAPQRQAIELAFYDGLSHAETAERLARPIGTFKSQIRRGLARLKGCLEGS
jgi:RNA polymerase sigma-70 factor (ECF subfamily)